jgi:hypothetical protein
MDRVAESPVVLVFIGPNWLNAKDERGGRRLDDPDDILAAEIVAALGRDIRVVPVLVHGASLPKESDLPDSLKPLARLKAVEIRLAEYGPDLDALVEQGRQAAGISDIPLKKKKLLYERRSQQPDWDALEREEITRTAPMWRRARVAAWVIVVLFLLLLGALIGLG